MASKIVPTPARPDDGPLKLMAKIPLITKALARPEGLVHPSGTLHSSLAAPGHRESQTPKVAWKQVAQPRPQGAEDDVRPRSVGGLKKKSTHRSPITGLLSTDRGQRAPDNGH